MVHREGIDLCVDNTIGVDELFRIIAYVNNTILDEKYEFVIIPTQHGKFLKFIKDSEGIEVQKQSKIQFDQWVDEAKKEYPKYLGSYDDGYDERLQQWFLKWFGK